MIGFCCNSTIKYKGIEMLEVLCRKSLQDFFQELNNEYDNFLDIYTVDKQVSILDIFSMEQVMQYFIPKLLLEELVEAFQYSFDNYQTNIIELNEQIDFKNITLEKYLKFEGILTYNIHIEEFILLFFTSDTNLDMLFKRYSKCKFYRKELIYDEQLKSIIIEALKTSQNYFSLSKSIRRNNTCKISIRKILKLYKQRKKILPLPIKETTINDYMSSDEKNIIEIDKVHFKDFMKKFNKFFLLSLARYEEYFIVSKISESAKNVIAKSQENPKISCLCNLGTKSFYQPDNFIEIYNGLVNTLMIMRGLNNTFDKKMKTINNLHIDRCIKNLYIIALSKKGSLHESDSTIKDTYLIKYFTDNKLDRKKVKNTTGEYPNKIYERYHTIMIKSSLNKFCLYDKTYKLDNETIRDLRQNERYIVNFHPKKEGLFYNPMLLDVLLSISYYISIDDDYYKFRNYFLGNMSNANINQQLYSRVVYYLKRHLDLEYNIIEPWEQFYIVYIKNLLFGLVNIGSIGSRDYNIKSVQCNNFFQTLSCFNPDIKKKDIDI